MELWGNRLLQNDSENALSEIKPALKPQSEPSFLFNPYSCHARVLEGVAESQPPLKAQAFQSQPPFM